MTEWNSLFAATAGASATLTGLLFVGVSINLTKVLSTAALPKRALVSIILLLMILVFSILVLMPGQTFTALGIRILALSVIAWIILLVIDFRKVGQLPKEFKKHYISNVVLDQTAVLFYLISAIVIIAEGERGLYYFVAAILFSFVKAIIDAWVLLVEINR